MVATLIILAWFGLAFGSFVNALVWRLHHNENTKKAKKLSIVNSRSICPNCKHQLVAKDLVPFLSWIWLRGRCRYCKKQISTQYPLIELFSALIFVFSYVFWPEDLNNVENCVLFITWLASFVGLLALLVYDARWKLLPNKIIYPTLLIALSGRFIYLISFEENKVYSLLMLLLSILIGSGVFFALYTISRGKWIGYGDVRLGLITGTLLATPEKSFLMIFLASILGLLFVLPALLRGKKSMTTQIPYGPYLIIATILVVWFGENILSWYKTNFLP